MQQLVGEKVFLTSGLGLYPYNGVVSVEARLKPRLILPWLFINFQSSESEVCSNTAKCER